MAESNATQVILTDDGIKIIKAQNTADNATSGITNLNDPNLMSVIEKQNNIGQFAGLTSQYNVLVQNAKDEGIDTAAVTTAYNNLNQFMADILADPNHASDVNRVTYKEYQDAYNEELSNLQNALQNNANNKFTSAASATSQAASMASQAFSAADSAYNYANSEIAVQSAATAKAQSSADNAFNQAQLVGSQATSAIAVQSTATAKAQSTADSAFSQAKTAIDNGKVTSQAVTDLKDGSTLTIAQLGNGLASKVSNSDYATYKTQTANQIGQLVTNSTFSAYQQTTADLIASKVATKDFSAYQATTAKSIDSKVESSDFNTYKTQTADAISSKVESSNFQALQTQVNNSVVGTNLFVGTKDFDNLSSWAGYNSNWNIITDTYNGLSIVQANQDWNGLSQYTQVSAGETYTFSIYARYVSGTGTSNFYIILNNDPENGHTAANVSPTYKSVSLTSNWQRVSITFTITSDGWIKPRIERTSTNKNTLQICGIKLEKGSIATDWSINPEDQATKSQITQLSGEIEQKVDSGDFSTYKTQTAQLIGSKVDNGAFSAYKTQTATAISSKVDNGDFSSYKTETAQLIGSKVESKDFNSYKTQTADMISSKVSSTDFNNLKVGSRNLYLNSKSIADGYSTLGGVTVTVESFDNTTNMWHIVAKQGAGANLGIYLYGYANEKMSNSSDWSYSADVKGTAKTTWFGIEAGNHKPIAGTISSEWSRISQTGHFDNAGIKTIVMYFDSTNSPVDVYIKLPKLESGNMPTDWSPAPEDLATQSQITQTAKDINLRVATKDLIDQINIQAGNTLISSSGQLTLSGKTIYFDSTNPVIIPSANIDTALVNKKLTAADISANTFTTNNGTFTVDSSGAITAKNMTIVDGTLTSPTINGSIINGSTINTPNLNMGDNGQITGDYSVHDDVGWFQPINGTGSLKIAHGYIQSTANIVYYNKILNGIGGDKWGHWASSTQFVPAPDQAHPDTCNVAESTLSPAFLKLGIYSADKSAVNSRVYIDGTGLYINDGSNSQAISAMLSDYELVSSGMAYLNTGIQMKQEASFTFGNLAMTGYHTIAMLDGNPLYFSDQAGGNGNPIEIKAKTFTKYSRLSVKHDITPLSTAESSRLLNAIDVEKFRYTHDGATYKYQYGGVIDDVNSLGSKQYSMPPELLSEDGTGINLDSLTGILVKRVQDQDKMIGELSMRLTRLEMEK